MLNRTGAAFVRSGSVSDYLLSAMCFESEDYKTKLAQMHRIYSTLRTIGPRSQDDCLQVPSNESIRAMIRERVLSERNFGIRRKVENKYVVQRTYSDKNKRANCM